MSDSDDAGANECSLANFSRIVVVLWVSTLATAFAVCGGFVFMIGEIMQIANLHSP